MKEIVEVAVGLPVSKTFHYRIPDKMKGSLQVGMRVLVPFKERKVTGFVLDLLDHPPQGIEEKLREVDDLLDDVPLIDPQWLRFCRLDLNLLPLSIGRGDQNRPSTWTKPEERADPQPHTGRDGRFEQRGSGAESGKDSQ